MAITAILGRMSHNFAQAVVKLVGAPYCALVQAAGIIAESNRLHCELKGLARLSDGQLAALGLTRDGEIRRILGTSVAI